MSAASPYRRSPPLRAHWIGAALVGAPALGGLGRAAGEPGFVRVTPAQVKWTSPNGADAPQVALIEGDPAKSGIYVQRNRFPKSVFSLSYTHDQDRHVVVLESTCMRHRRELRPEAGRPARPRRLHEAPRRRHPLRRRARRRRRRADRRKSGRLCHGHEGHA